MLRALCVPLSSSCSVSGTSWNCPCLYPLGFLWLFFSPPLFQGPIAFTRAGALCALVLFSHDYYSSSAIILFVQEIMHSGCQGAFLGRAQTWVLLCWETHMGAINWFFVVQTIEAVALISRWYRLNMSPAPSRFLVFEFPPKSAGPCPLMPGWFPETLELSWCGSWKSLCYREWYWEWHWYWTN